MAKATKGVDRIVMIRIPWRKAWRQMRPSMEAPTWNCPPSPWKTKRLWLGTAGRFSALAVCEPERCGARVKKQNYLVARFTEGYLANREACRLSFLTKIVDTASE
jgi:hypothetical protein